MPETINTQGRPKLTATIGPSVVAKRSSLTGAGRKPKRGSNGTGAGFGRGFPVDACAGDPHRSGAFRGFDVVIGILIVRSSFLPRIFGLLMALAGLGWLIYLWPPLTDQLSRVVQPMGFLSEAVLMVWLLAKGVDEEQWRVRAGYKAARS